MVTVAIAVITIAIAVVTIAIAVVTVAIAVVTVSISVATEVSISEVSVVGVVAESLDGVSVAWSVSMVRVDVVGLFDVWLIKSVEWASFSWSVSGVWAPGVTVVSNPSVTVMSIEVWVACSGVVRCLVVMSWPVDLTMVALVGASPVWTMLSVRAIKHWLESWVDVSSSGLVGLLKSVSLSHGVSEVLLMGLDLTSVVINFMMVLGVRELDRVDDERSLVWVSNGGIWV